jgi:hypothetical protein
MASISIIFSALLLFYSCNQPVLNSGIVKSVLNDSIIADIEREKENDKDLEEEKLADTPDFSDLGSGVIGGTKSNSQCLSLGGLSEIGLNDPYSSCQWHLQNTGQRIARSAGNANSYPSTGSVGADINGVTYALKNYSGKDVNVQIVDDSFPQNHPDFRANYDRSNSRNCSTFGAKGNDPENNGGNHGVMVTGIVGAVGNNGQGVSGIASEANISGFTPFVCGQSSFNRAADAAGTHIWNGSFGIPGCGSHRPSYNANGTPSNDLASYSGNAVENGIAFFKSAGNGRRSNSRCPGGHEDSNREETNVSPYVGLIAALDVNGQVTTYSTPSAGLLAGGFAGYGGNNGSQSGIWTISGAAGYTSSMNGTSAASPVVAGVMAVVKEANMELGPLDLFYIIAQSARPLNEPATTTRFESKNSLNGKPYINKQTNAKGYTHSFNSGFGIINLDKAVRIAEFFKDRERAPLPDLVRYSDHFDLDEIPTSSSGSSSIAARACQTKEISLDKEFQIFSLEISFQAQGAINGLIGFYEMPDGTRAQIMRDSNISGSQYSHRQRFKVMSAFALNTKGTWKFELCNNSSSAVTYNEVRMDAWGFADLESLKARYK